MCATVFIVLLQSSLFATPLTVDWYGLSTNLWVSMHSKSCLPGSYLSRCTVSCEFAFIRTWQHALRSVVSSSSETGTTSPLSYKCMYSVSLARASCIGVLSEALRSFMCICFDCQYAARLEVCVLKFTTYRCVNP